MLMQPWNFLILILRALTFVPVSLIIFGITLTRKQQFILLALAYFVRKSVGHLFRFHVCNLMTVIY